MQWIMAKHPPERKGTYLVWLKPHRQLDYWEIPVKLAFWQKPASAVAGDGWFCIGKVRMWAEVPLPSTSEITEAVREDQHGKET